MERIYFKYYKALEYYDRLVNLQRKHVANPNDPKVGRNVVTQAFTQLVHFVNSKFDIVSDVVEATDDSGSIHYINAVNGVERVDHIVREVADLLSDMTAERTLVAQFRNVPPTLSDTDFAFVIVLLISAPGTFDVDMLAQYEYRGKTYNPYVELLDKINRISFAAYRLAHSNGALAELKYNG